MDSNAGSLWGLSACSELFLNASQGGCDPAPSTSVLAASWKKVVERDHPDSGCVWGAKKFPVLLRLIARTVSCARNGGNFVGIFGALASDLISVPVVLGFSVTDLSVSPSLAPEIKVSVRTLDQHICRKHVEQLLTLESAISVRAQAADLWPCT